MNLLNMMSYNFKPERNLLILILIIFTSSVSMGQADNKVITYESAIKLAKIPLKCIQQEYPNKLNQVLGEANDLLPPTELHPAFFGCFDWHSSVHGHWMLVKLIKLFPDIPEVELIREKLGQNLSYKNIQAELAYFNGTHNKTFERTYGWAWLLKLAQELNEWDDKQGAIWYKNLKPLTDLITIKYEEFLPKLTYPIRTGEHPNTAFAISLAYDYALSTGNNSLKQLLEERSRDFFLDDTGCPVSWEPNGFDFLSPCLEEANLMERILSQEEYYVWIRDFIPDFGVMIPAIVSDRSDPKIVHLDGLNFSRTWCLYGISKSLPNPQKESLKKIADNHFEASFAYIFSGNYEGEHWLASFALLALTSRY